MTNPLLARFIPEARELLESSSSSLLALEKRPDDATAVNEVFRAVHTLKGSSGLFDALALTKLVHVAEDLLGAVRSEKLALNPDIVDDLFAAFDQVSVWIGAMEETERLPADADKVSGKLSQLLRAHLAAPGEAEAAPSAVAGEVDPARRDQWLALFDADARAAAREKLVKGADVTLIRYTPPENAFFCGSDPLNLMLGAPGLIAVECAPARPIAPLAEYEPYQCNLVFTALAGENEDEIAQHLRYEMEHVTLCVLHAELFPEPSRAKTSGAPATAPRHVVLARSIVANQRRALFSAEYAPERISAAASAVARLAASLRRLDWAAAAIAGKHVNFHSPKDASDTGIATVYQDLALCDNLDIVQNMLLGHEVRTKAGLLDEITMEQTAKRTLSELRVTTVRNIRQPVGSLSGGQRQSVAVAKAVMLDAKLVIMDEPTAALGVSQTALILDLIGRLSGRGIAVLLISHNLTDVFQVADRLAVLYLGRLVTSGPLSDYRTDSAVHWMTTGTAPGAKS